VNTLDPERPLRLLFGSRAHPLRQSMQCRIIDALSPFTGHLRCLLIRTGGSHGKTELLSKPRRDFLMRTQSPKLLDCTDPLFTIGVLPIINGQSYFSELASQRKTSMFSLAEGGKPRCADLRVVEVVLPIAAAPTHGSRRLLHVRSRQGWA
jgi:hypothetical protein